MNTGVKSRAAVIYPEITSRPLSVSGASRLAEACGLAGAINLEVAHKEIVRLREIRPATFISPGILDRLQPQFAEKQIELLIVDAGLTPIQQRNLENRLKIKVIDRTALILEIFGERAQTREGKLQVELAHLTYQRSRLVRSWTHLERQRGGAGFLGGPGETQIELDRRIIDDKIVRIKKDLEKVKRTRAIQRSARSKIPYPIVALVGYTNAGKSSLFNRLTAASVRAEDMLFATLDPAMRKLRLPSGREAILSDTVGFISDLPHELIMAFRATLEEVLSADIIVHLRDAANPESRQQKSDVLKVLESLGLQNMEDQPNYFEVLNKIDLLPEAAKAEFLASVSGRPGILPVSAVTGEGTEQFLQKIDEALAAADQIVEVTVPIEDGRLQAWLHQNAEVLKSTPQEAQIRFRLRISDTARARLFQMRPEIGHHN